MHNCQEETLQFKGKHQQQYKLLKEESKSNVVLNKELLKEASRHSMILEKNWAKVSMEQFIKLNINLSVMNSHLKRLILKVRITTKIKVRFLACLENKNNIFNRLLHTLILLALLNACEINKLIILSKNFAAVGIWEITLAVLQGKNSVKQTQLML